MSSAPPYRRSLVRLRQTARERRAADGRDRAGRRESRARAWLITRRSALERIASAFEAILVEDDEVLAIRDVNPQAPVHILVLPREHIESVAELTPSQDGLWGRMLHVAQAIAEDEGIDETGFRLVVNTGKMGGQTVNHLHMHLLGGRQMTWPPG